MIADLQAIRDALYNSPLSKYKKCILAVSGGIDSMVLLDAIAQYKATIPPSSVFSECSVAYINHNLREESDEEALFVKEESEKRQMSCVVLSWSNCETYTHRTQKKKMHGLEEKARLARYRLLWKHAAEIQANCVVTAHQLDDQWETFLMRLKRGSGLKGLCSPHSLTSIDDIHLLRPFHKISRSTIENWRTYYQIPVKHDVTNNDRQQERARLRRMTNLLKNEGLSLPHFAKTIERLQSAQQTIQSITDEKWHDHNNIKIYTWGYIDMAAPVLLSGSYDEIHLNILSKALASVGGYKGQKKYAVHTKNNETLLRKIQFDIQNDLKCHYVTAQTRIEYNRRHKILRFSREIARNKPEKTQLYKNKRTFFDNRFLCTPKLDCTHSLQFVSWSIGYYSKDFFDACKDNFLKNNMQYLFNHNTNTDLLCTVPILHCFSPQNEDIYGIPSSPDYDTDILEYKAYYANGKTCHISIPFIVRFTPIHGFLYDI